MSSDFNHGAGGHLTSTFFLLTGHYFCLSGQVVNNELTKSSLSSMLSVLQMRLKASFENS